MASCDIPADAPLVRGLLDSVDCNVGEVVAGGYAALSAPGSEASLLLTSAMVIFVALFGYRLLLGRTLSLGDAASAAIKVGVVLLLATNWAAYQALVFDTLYDGPEALAATLLGSATNAGSAFAGNPIDGLQRAFDALQEGVAFYGGRAGAASPFIGGVAFGAASLNGASLLLLLSTAGLLVASKIVLGFLLALAPIIAALILFDATRGMATGWLRAMVTLALVPLAVILALSLELALLEPVLADLAAMRAAGDYRVAPVMQAGMIVMVFTGVILAACWAGAMIARGIRLPGPRPAEALTPQVATAPSAAPVVIGRSARIAAAAAGSLRRETRTDATFDVRRTQMATGAARGGDARTSGGAAPLGTSFRRPVRTRGSAASARRDG
jgi:type IV secretion system protein VirB6